MIEVEIARSGQKIIRKNGRLLASAINPEQEAVSWAQKALDGVAQFETVFILGAGSGHHISQVLKTRPSQPVVVIEKDRAVADKAVEICPEIQRLELIIEENWVKVIEHDAFKDAVEGPYHIALHGPSFQNDVDYFSRIESLLRGRDKLSFLLLLKSRPDFLALFCPESIGQMGDGPVSIKTLQDLFSAKSNSSRERRLWRVLEELVL